MERRSLLLRNLITKVVIMKEYYEKRQNYEYFLELFIV